MKWQIAEKYNHLKGLTLGSFTQNASQTNNPRFCVLPVLEEYVLAQQPQRRRESRQRLAHPPLRFLLRGGGENYGLGPCGARALLRANTQESQWHEDIPRNEDVPSRMDTGHQRQHRALPTPSRWTIQH
jgi:hypothetical protein